MLFLIFLELRKFFFQTLDMHGHFAKFLRHGVGNVHLVEVHALAAAFVLGMAGFGVLVDKLYPALGAAGIAMSIVAFYRVVCHDNESCALMCARH